MRMAKEALEKTVEKLTERAADCFDRAQVQQVIADQQHIVADRQHAVADRQSARAEELVTLGEALESDAAKLNDELEIISPRALQVPDQVPSKGVLPPVLAGMK